MLSQPRVEVRRIFPFRAARRPAIVEVDEEEAVVEEIVELEGEGDEQDGMGVEFEIDFIVDSRIVNEHEDGDFMANYAN